jgi:hypothetical protein
MESHGGKSFCVMTKGILNLTRDAVLNQPSCSFSAHRRMLAGRPPLREQVLLRQKIHSLVPFLPTRVVPGSRRSSFTYKRSLT